MTMDPGKRKLVKALGASGAIGLGLKTGVIPASWVKPVIDSVIPSAHAQITFSPSPSPAPAAGMAEPVPVASTGLIAVVAGALGYVGFRGLRRSNKAHSKD